MRKMCDIARGRNVDRLLHEKEKQHQQHQHLQNQQICTAKGGAGSAGADPSVAAAVAAFPRARDDPRFDRATMLTHLARDRAPYWKSLVRSTRQ